MGFKRGLLIGLGVGYVLGAKAGRERYEEIRQAWGRFTGHPTVQEVLGKGRDVVRGGAEAGLHLVEEGVTKAADTVKRKLEGQDEEGWEPISEG